MNRLTKDLVNAARNAIAEEVRERGDYLGGVEQAVEFVKDKMAEEGGRECFAVMYCDTQHSGIAWEVAAPERDLRNGDYRREVARKCLELGARSIFLATNHKDIPMSPSERVWPTREDREITRELVATLGMFDVEIVDHIIVHEEKRYFSMTQEGLEEITVGTVPLRIREGPEKAQEALER